MSDTPVRMDRRTFLARSAAAAVLVAAAELPGCGRGCDVRGPTSLSSVPGPPRFTDTEFKTLAALQDRLLPSDPGSPGARDVLATAYLDAALAEVGGEEERGLVRGGLAELETISRELGGAPFVALPEGRQEAAMRALEKLEGGRDWFILVMTYTLEAFLGDPVHGGNPNGIAWAYLKTSPLFPRPPASAGRHL